jgi:SulP family sulfate permease
MSSKRLTRFSMSHWWVPPTLRDYRAAWLGVDALAGLTLVAMALPSQLATARLANVPAVLGLYAFVSGSLCYAVIGPNRVLSIGADSTIAPVLAAAAASIAPVGSSRFVTVMSFTALVVGAILLAVGLFRLGWISEFLSIPVTTGILGGIAVEIISRQVHVVLGLNGGGNSTVDRVRFLIDQIDQVNGWTLCIALGVFAIIAGAQCIDHRIPGALLGLALSLVASDALSLPSRHGVAVLGTVHGGLPEIRLPSASWSQLREVFPSALTVAFICIAQTAATVKLSTSGQPATREFNRDLFAVGAGSIAAGLMGAIAVDASPPNTAVVAASGARSQLTNIVAGAIALGVVVSVTAPLAHLPQATLSAILVFVATKLFRPGELRMILRFDRGEFSLAAATLLAVALIGIEQGVVLAMILSLASRTKREARPRDAILGRESGTDHWIPNDIGRPTEQVAGVMVYLFYGSLWYGNASYFYSRARRLIDHGPSPVQTVILDANAIPDIDYTGLQALKALAREFKERGVTFEIARASHLVHHALKHGALLTEIGPDHLYASVEDAVSAVQR